MELPRASQVIQTVKNLSMMQETQAQIPWKGMATHASVLAWKIPWTEPGGLQLVNCSCIELDMTERLSLGTVNSDMDSTGQLNLILSLTYQAEFLEYQ